jgi:hypothetical protein
MLQRTYMESTEEIGEHAWSGRPRWQRAAQNAAGLLGPLL